MTEAHAPRDPDVITDAQDLAEALVKAFVDGDDQTRQHIVDTLGERSRKRSS
ncbi:hypothetical protein [Saccharothrix sp. NRRL B-16348]|uniref:hypothetical protein n=1 Tax=Saccharothrix sp. NRRL B-16348 TaxID=1415542 RepID=UPI000B2DAC16|nr:hypothetical protein [Saccharothrix sp. NRRL B-16348]